MAEQRFRFVDGKASVHVWHHRVDVVDRAEKITGVFEVEAQLCCHLRDTRAVATLDPFGDSPMKELAAGRRYASPDDVQALAGPVLAHRVLLTTQAKYGGVTARAVLDGIVQSVEVPT